MGNVVLKKILGKKWGMYRGMKKAVALFLFVILIVASIDSEKIMGFAEDSDELNYSYTVIGSPQLFEIDDESDTEHGWNPESENQKLTEVEKGYWIAKFNCSSEGEYEFKVIENGEIFKTSYQLCIGNPSVAWADNQTLFKVKLEAGEYTIVMNPSQGMVV